MYQYTVQNTRHILIAQLLDFKEPRQCAHIRVLQFGRIIDNRRPRRARYPIVIGFAHAPDGSDARLDEIVLRQI